MIVLESLFPVFILVLLGIVLKKTGFTDEGFLRCSDKLIYYICFPVMLFWKIGGASHQEGINWLFCSVTLGVVVSMFALSTLVIRLAGIRPFEAGSFSQSCYRFNTYIGVAVVLNAFGEEGLALFGVMIGVVIPIINVFAVSVLIWFSGSELGGAARGKVVLRALAANPLIIGCVAGLVYAEFANGFPQFINNTLSLLSMVTLPMALLSIGGALTFKGIRTYFPASMLAACLKLLVLPVCGYAAYTWFGVDGLAFKVGMVFFTLPASTAIYVLSSQLNSNTELASSAIVLSTILSFVTLSVALLL